MKKLLILLTTIFCAIPTFANNVSSIAVDVCIDDTGKAKVTEEWKGTFNQGTEVYIPIEDKSLVISDFNVIKDGYEFAHSNNWNVKGSFQEKSGKCGILRTDKGVELCFGITTYGENTYIISYTIDPFIKSYRDYDGFNFQFINPHMSIFPTAVSMRLRFENGFKINEENARIWGFGFDGQTAFVDGDAIAYTINKLNDRNYFNIMMSFNKGIINPNASIKESFDTVIDKAFEGSSYSKNYNENKGIETFVNIVLIIIRLIIWLTVFFVGFKFISLLKRIIDLKNFYKKVNYFRDVPNNGNISLTYSMFEDFDIWNSNDSNIISALIIKMINEKCIEVVERKSVGLFGREKISNDLKLKKEPKDIKCKELYDIIKNAAGSDNILQENELKEYAKENYNDLENLLLNLKHDGQSFLNKKGGYKKILGTKLNNLTDYGKEQLSEIYGLRKFLDEFTLLNERKISESVIWEDLMVYATLFGVAKKVINNLKKIYPNRTKEIEIYATNIYISDVYFRALYFSSVNARHAMQAARAASGVGGFTSIGGGGGFSGGGFGGGTR